MDYKGGPACHNVSVYVIAHDNSSVLTDVGLRLRLLRVDASIRLIERLGGRIPGAALQRAIQRAHLAAGRMSGRCLWLRAVRRFARTPALTTIATVFPSRRFLAIVLLRPGLLDQLTEHTPLRIG